MLVCYSCYWDKNMKEIRLISSACSLWSGTQRNLFYVHSIITRNQSVLTWGLYSINNAPTAVGGRDPAYHKGLYRELRPLYSSAHSRVNKWNTSAYSAASYSWWLSLKLDKIRSVHLNKLCPALWTFYTSFYIRRLVLRCVLDFVEGSRRFCHWIFVF